MTIVLYLQSLHLITMTCLKTCFLYLIIFIRVEILYTSIVPDVQPQQSEAATGGVLKKLLLKMLQYS